MQQRRWGEAPDKRTFLALKTSSLSTFAARLRKLGRQHTVAPNEPEWKLPEDQCQEEMAISPANPKRVDPSQRPLNFVDGNG